MLELTKQLFDETSQESFGNLLGQSCSSGLVIFLEGELGAGKTTLARGFIRGLGHHGKVKSPTYSLVEEYDLREISNKNCYHFDLYRLADPEELEYMGMRDFTLERDILLIEWPEKGEGWLPRADLIIEILYENQSRKLNLKAMTEKGNSYLKQLPL